jgi:hypothetical protein
MHNRRLQTLTTTFFLAIFGLAGQQVDSLRLARVVPVAAAAAALDHLDHLYVLTPENAVEKYDAAGRLMARYSNNRLGRATALDVGNPLKVLVWYSDFRTVQFLDRSLTLLGELSLVRAGFPDVRVVAAARDGNLWLYDEAAFRLRKVDPEGVVLFESPALHQLLSGPVGLTALREGENEVYALTTGQQMLAFDPYAQLLRQWPATDTIVDFQVLKGGLQYLGRQAIWMEDARGGGRLVYRWPQQEGPVEWSISPGILFGRGREKLFMFRAGN